ncbi:Nuclear polyadenylated RNA-binding protein [Hirschfeldia incana]|nr:Nuclear polyadenylated RNA-binding protein [Hirschfeldia incana]KAJ0242403.1 Nuclear polyadenylated RNA-binding protein [Hirschfeldia incana]
MRVLLCKIQCPSFFCFCKPSPHIHAASASLKLEENTPPQVDDNDDDDDHYVDAHAAECVDHVDEDHALEEKEEACAVEEKQEKGEILRSSLKKKAVLDSPREKKKKVQWVDLMGKELAEIREFESSEEDDIRYDGDQSCVCVIL